MSLAPYTYRPATPPEARVADHLMNGHSQYYTTDTPYYSSDPSPDSTITHLITPSRSPTQRQHGPTLLPKIRTQDSMVDSAAGGPKRTHRRALSTAQNPPAYAPYTLTRPPMQRSATEPVECKPLISPISNSSYYGSRAASVARSPTLLTVPHCHSRTSSSSHSRGGSTSSIDGTMLSRYGYPTYRQLPVYVSQAPAQRSPSPTAFAPTTYVPYQPPIQIIEATPYQPQDDFDFQMDFTTDAVSYPSRPTSMTPPRAITPSSPSTSLLSCLTSPTPPLNLTRHLAPLPPRALQSHFWWDVRNIRPWTSFSLETIASIPGLEPLLTLSIDSTVVPEISNSSSTLTPNSESHLTSLLATTLFARLNAAAMLAQGSSAIQYIVTPPHSQSVQSTVINSAPTFLATYPHDHLSKTLTGLPRGRVVGLALAFDRWNTGMRASSSPARKVDYLNGLARLQYGMREHGCRYGFLCNEIECIVVRVGGSNESAPLFGYLEVSEAIPFKNARQADGELEDGPMTVQLALWFLLMLAKNTPLPGQMDGGMDVGAPGAMTRANVWRKEASGEVEIDVRDDGRDKWIPEPQMGEKRDAKRCRGWVWPADPWHKREGMGMGVSRRTRTT